MSKHKREVLSTSLTETEEIARSIVLRAKPHKREAFVVALDGELGAGKTHIAKAIARAFAIEDTVQSPTFVLMKSYPITHPYFTVLYHFDWYRIVEDTEVRMLGWNSIVANHKAFVVVEWANRCASILPTTALYMSIEVVSTHKRKITFRYEA